MCKVDAALGQVMCQRWPVRCSPRTTLPQLAARALSVTDKGDLPPRCRIVFPQWLARLLPRWQLAAQWATPKAPTSNSMSASQADLLRQLSLDRNTLNAPRPRRWPWWLAAVVIIAAVVFLALQQKPAATATASFELVEVRAADQAASATGAVLDASGYVIARRAATVSAKVTGKVLEVNIEEGQKVQEGQILARLDDANSQAQLDLARAQAQQAGAQAAELRVALRNAERDLTRQRDVFAKKFVAQAAVDNAETNVEQIKARLQSVQRAVDVAERQVEVARRSAEDSIIRAPFTGVVTVKNAQPGEMISPLSGGGSSFTRSGIGTLVDMNSQEIEVDVAESFISKVQAGAPVSIKLNAYPDAEFKGSVIALVPTADRAKATVKVRVGFARNADGSLDSRILPELGARVSFLNPTPSPLAAPKGGVYIPLEALYGEDGERHVFLADRGSLRKLPVQTATREGTAWHVPSGLVAGAKVAIGTDLKDGLPVPKDEGQRP